MTTTGTGPRVGLVLGGGAVQGAVWLEGALAALAERTGWNPGSAEVVLGTSAGSWLATALASGVPAWLLAAASAGESIDGLIPGPAAPGPYLQPGLRARAGALRPGSPMLLARGALRPWRYSAAHLAAGWMPRSRRNSGVVELVRMLVPSGWPDHPGLGCVVCDYATGERVVLRRDGDRTCPDVAEAVAASCAVPGYFRPARIAGRDYVDGGVHSISNLDLAAGLGLDLVICLNPTSSLDLVPPHGPAEALYARIRRYSGRRLGREARRVRESGTRVALIQPTARDLAVLGSNWLRPSRHAEIIDLARETVGEQVDRLGLRHLLAGGPHPPEHLVRRPPGPRSGWPALPVPPMLHA